MLLVFTANLFVCKCSFDEREIPRKAGFRWTKERPFWHSDAPMVAARLRKFADSSARKELNRVTIEYSPWSGPLPYPSALTPYPFQKDPAALFALSRNRSYLALDPGLGKTPVAGMVRNALNVPTVYISPPFLTRNVEEEFNKWSTLSEDGPEGARLEAPAIVRLDTKEAPIYTPDVLIVPDSIIHRPEVRGEIFGVAARAEKLGVEPLLFVDEAQRFKTPEALRTEALFGSEEKDGIIKAFPRQVYLSGTPMPNRPIELYSVLSKVAPETIDFMSYDEFGLRFCNGFFDGYGYDFISRDAKLEDMRELRRRVYGTFMLRLKKKDVLKELPPKTEELVIIGDRPAKLIAMEEEILREHSPEDLMTGKVATDNLATYRKELGLLKVKPAVDFIKSLLEESSESLLIFAYHKDVIEELSQRLKKFEPLVITGKTPMGERNEIVKKFQTEPKRRLFIGNYLAAGIGLTLTKATRVIFVEFSFVPTENDQASDRAHRIGQKDHVFVQFLIYANSVDRKVMEINFRKKKIINFI